MLKQLKSALVYTLIASFSFLSLTQTANATLISTQQLASANTTLSNKGPLTSALERPEVQAQLESLGISKEDAERRIASLTEEEIHALNNKIENLPAGAGVVGALILIFVVLLVTDILGFTKVYPFTKPIGQ
jgi:hypothetical protein